MVPVRVLVDVELRQTLRLTRREKKARLFLPREAKGSLEAFLDHVYQVRQCVFFLFPLNMFVGVGAGKVVYSRRPTILHHPPNPTQQQAFPVQGMPHTLVAKIRRSSPPQQPEASSVEAALVDRTGRQEGEGQEGQLFITLRTDADLARAFAEAEQAGQMVQVRTAVDDDICWFFSLRL